MAELVYEGVMACYTSQKEEETPDYASSERYRENLRYLRDMF